MLVAKYDIPLPNNGDKYSLTQDELVKLLDRVYERGYENARNAISSHTVAWTSSDMGDEQNDWYNIQFVEGEH